MNKRLLCCRTLLTGCIAAASAADGPASQPVASQPASRSTSQPASQPVRTPEQEANLALDLVDQGRARDAIPLASSAYQRETKPGLGLLAIATALDAAGQSFESIEYFRKYIDTALGQNDWRGYARLGSVYVRSRNYRIARKFVEQAERRIPATFGRARIYVVIDLADSQAGCQELAAGRATLENLLRAMPEAAAEPRYWLTVARLAFTGADVNLDTVDATIQKAVDAGVRMAQAARPDDIAAARELLEAFGTARFMRQSVADLLEKREKNPAAVTIATTLHRSRVLTSLARTMAQEARMQRRVRLLDALDIARKAVELDATDADAKLTVAELLIELGDAPAAERMIRQVLLETPSNAAAKELLKRLTPTGK